MGKNALVFVMLEVGTISATSLLPLESLPSWLRLLIVIVCYGTPAILLMPENWRIWLWKRLRFTPPNIGWKNIAYVALLVIIAQFAAPQKDSIYNLAGWAGDRLALGNLLPKPKRTDNLFIRPICSSDCGNFSFLN